MYLNSWAWASAWALASYLTLTWDVFKYDYLQEVADEFQI